MVEHFSEQESEVASGPGQASCSSYMKKFCPVVVVNRQVQFPTAKTHINLNFCNKLAYMRC
jgi:hypothetical protein